MAHNNYKVVNVFSAVDGNPKANGTTGVFVIISIKKNERDVIDAKFSLASISTRDDPVKEPETTKSIRYKTTIKNIFSP
jgi:hypothetical protein